MGLFKILILLNSILSALNYEYNKDIKKYYSLSAILESPDAMWEKCLDNSFLEFYTAPLFFKWLISFKYTNRDVTHIFILPL